MSATVTIRPLEAGKVELPLGGPSSFLALLPVGIYGTDALPYLRGVRDALESGDRHEAVCRMVVMIEEHGAIHLEAGH